MKFLIAAATITVSAFLGGCASAPPMNFSVSDVGFSQKKIDAELKSMTVTIARPEEKTGNLPAGIETIVPQLWKTALTESLNKMAIFQDDAIKKVNLSVKILKLDIPNFGAGMTTQTEARYELMDRKSGDLIYTQEIESSGDVPWDHAFDGKIRARESINRAVQNNIKQFLQALETIDVTKPMFPVKTIIAK
jgi:hypothetical protein